jgi:hypothetical protein
VRRSRSCRPRTLSYKTARFNAAFTAGDVRLYRPLSDIGLRDTVNPLEYPSTNC